MNQPHTAESDAGLEGRLRTAFQHVLFLGSRDVDSSKWYAEELAKIALREFTRDIPPAMPEDVA